MNNAFDLLFSFLVISVIIGSITFFAWRVDNVTLAKRVIERHYEPFSSLGLIGGIVVLLCLLMLPVAFLINEISLFIFNNLPLMTYIKITRAVLILLFLVLCLGAFMGIIAISLRTKTVGEMERDEEEILYRDSLDLF